MPSRGQLVILGSVGLIWDRRIVIGGLNVEISSTDKIEFYGP